MLFIILQIIVMLSDGCALIYAQCHIQALYTECENAKCH
jgi:hypothetical protein